MSDRSRRQVLKRGALGMSILGFGKTAGTAGASTGYAGNYEELRRDFLKHVQRHGAPEITSRFAQVENEIIQQTTEAVSTEGQALADEYYTAFYDTLKFGTVDKEIAYYRDESDLLYVDFDGNTYEITQLERIQRKVRSKLEKQDSDNPNTNQNRSSTNQREVVNVGNKEVLTCLGNSDLNGTPWWEGAAKSREKTEGCDTVGGELQVAYLADATIHAELWKEVEFQGGNGNELLEIEGAGSYAGSASSALGGGSIRGTVFLRDIGGGNEETEHVLEKNLGLIDGWGANENYNDSLYERVQNDTYEIGIRLRINAAAATTASAIADLYTDRNGPDWQIRGFFDMSYLALKWP